MKDERIAEALAVHGERRGDRVFADETADLSEEERRELESLIRVAERLERRMQPVDAPPAFVKSLGKELVEAAEQRVSERERRHRITVIGAAVAGAVVSIASVIGGVVVLIRWLRTRTEARQASTA
ncbi:MAG: hypothetical protein U9R72_04925 [Chloroflexota bacterium]|nr:hypothetical protein [Chloroflexota bacterium]